MKLSLIANNSHVRVIAATHGSTKRIALRFPNTTEVGNGKFQKMRLIPLNVDEKFEKAFLKVADKDTVQKLVNDNKNTPLEEAIKIVVELDWKSYGVKSDFPKRLGAYLISHEAEIKKYITATIDA